MSEAYPHRQYEADVANRLDQYLGPYSGDIYLTALDLFSRLNYPRHASLYFRDDIDGMAAGMNEHGNVLAVISTNPNIVSPEARQHINERFQLTEAQQRDEVYAPIMLAHELAHTIQQDEAFAEYFGELADNYVDQDEDFAAYVNSDEELNADYIAAVIVGNSQLGQQINFLPPTESPLDWRTWANEHPVPQSIALDLANRNS